jgi:hypothetical protein
MTHYLDSQLALEDLLADLHFARKHEQLGRLALLAYCEVKGWARRSGKLDVAEVALKMFSENPCVSKREFLLGIDALIETLELHENQYLQINRRHALDASPSLGAIGFQ